MWTFNRTDLFTALALVKPGLAESRTLPVLRNILIEFGPEGASVRSTNLSTTIKARLPVTGEGSSGICLPGDLLVECVSAWPDVPIYVEIADDTRTAVLRLTETFDKTQAHLNHTTTLRGWNPGDFPSVPTEDDAIPAFTLPADRLHRLINFAAAAMHRKSGGRESMHTVSLQTDASKGSVYGVGSDGVRLHVAEEVATDPPIRDGGWLLDSSLVPDVLSVLSRLGDTPITVYALPGKMLFFVAPTCTVTARINEGKYFAWQTVVQYRAEADEERITLLTGELRTAARVVSTISKEADVGKTDAARIKLDVSGDALVLTAHADERASAIATVDPLSGSIPGRAPFEVNATMFTDAIRLVASPETILRVPRASDEPNERAALVITDAEERYSAYLMPMRDRVPA